MLRWLYICAVCLLWGIQPAWGTEPLTVDIPFRHLTVADGLSHNTVLTLLQDRRGFVWIGTFAGLDRFDGKHFCHYQAEIGNDKSLSSNYVRVLYEDREGWLWVGTFGGGLNRMDPQTGLFKRFVHDPERSDSLADNKVTALCSTSREDLWIGTVNGLHRLDTRSGTIRRIVMAPSLGAEPFQETIYALAADERGRIWIGTQLGLVSLDTGDERCTYHPLLPPSDGDARWPVVRSILPGERGIIWLGTQHGVIRFDTLALTFRLCWEHIRSERPSNRYVISDMTLDEQKRLVAVTRNGLIRLDDRTSATETLRMVCPTLSGIPSPETFALFTDRSGSLWLGTERGLLIARPQDAPIDLVGYNPSDATGLCHPDVRSFFESRDGTIWIGTANGLNAWDRQTGSMRRYFYQEGPLSKGDENQIHAVSEDHEGRLWMATQRGLRCFDPRQERLLPLRTETRDLDDLAQNEIHRLLWEGDNRLWFMNRFGVGRLDLRSGLIQWPREKDGDKTGHFRDAPMAMMEDSRRRIWIGTRNGLFRIDRHSSPPAMIPVPLRLDEQQGDLYIYHIVEDAYQNLWLGTLNGLIRYTPGTGAVHHFGTRAGLSGNVVFSITEDGAGCLWLGTNRGLSRFDPRTERVRTFGLEQGVQDLEFNHGVCLKCRDGSLLFGGVNGFNSVDPLHLPAVLKRSPLAISRVEIQPGHRILPTGIEDGQVIELHPEDVQINIDLALLIFSGPATSRYAYKIEGLHREWIDLGHASSLSLSGLPSGRHALRIKEAGADGQWSEEGISLWLVVIPPFYRTWWFLTLSALLLLSAAYVLGATHRQRLAGRIRDEAELKAKGASLGLSAREQEIVLLILAGRSNKEIEDLLFIAESTVRNHIYSVYRKLGLKNRAHLVNYFRNLKG